LTQCGDGVSVGQCRGRVRVWGGAVVVRQCVEKCVGGEGVRRCNDGAWVGQCGVGEW